jgi:hypothetical protein
VARRSVKKARSKEASLQKEKYKILAHLGAGRGSSKLRARLREIESEQHEPWTHRGRYRPKKTRLAAEDFAPHPDFLDPKLGM